MNRLVKEGKSRRVGLWLLFNAGALFTLGTVGGYTRNMRFGINKIEWRPDFSPPKSESDWNEKYEKFKQTGEYTSRGHPASLEEFKETYWLATVGGVFGISSAAIFAVPMLYFMARGYFKAPMYKFSLLYASLFAAIGFHGKYADDNRPGMIEGEPMPPKDPNAKTIHSLLYYMLYSVNFWQMLKLLGPNPNDVKKLKHHFGKLTLRKHLMITSHTLYTLVLLSGFLMAGHGAGRAINTYPKVGDKWLITKDDFDQDITTAENFVSNKRVIHFTHRTLGTILLPVFGLQYYMIMRSPLNGWLKL